jgi:hypothetical protein
VTLFNISVNVFLEPTRALFHSRELPFGFLVQGSSLIPADAISLL